MSHYYVHAQGDSTLSLGEINRIADSKSGALIAVDGIDSSDILAGKAQLPLKTVDEQRDYLFYIVVEDQKTATDSASDILNIAHTERDKPVYSDFQRFLSEYSQASWRDHIQALLLYDDYDESRIDLLIFVPGQSENDAAKIYYRGSAAHCCCDLIKHFTDIMVKV